MNQKLESIIKKGRVIALAGAAALAIGCATVPSEPPAMGQMYLTGRTMDDKFSGLSTEKQNALVKSLNNLAPWENVLLARYVPIDGLLKELSSFYSNDYKEFLQTILAQSTLDPTAVGPTGSKGFGQLAASSEKWARDLYHNRRLAYKFPGQAITNNSSDIYTNLVLSSILFRKAAEEKVLDLDALCSLYGNGFNGVTLKDGTYRANETGTNMVSRVKSFDSIADKLMAFSWISMNHPELSKDIEDANLKKILEANSGAYDSRAAYEGMIEFLNGISTNKKYLETDQKMFRNEAINISDWVKSLYGVKK
jgi:hypothetical protein